MHDYKACNAESRLSHVKMCDEQSNVTQDEESQSATKDSSSLLHLPVEILLHICSFLDTGTLVHGLSLVCKHFHQILNDDSLWKVRIKQIWPNSSYPILPPDEDDKLFWKTSCLAIERQVSHWTKEDSMEKLSLSNVQYSTIDGLLLMNGGNICISGARDRSLVYWSLSADKNKCGSSMIVSAHRGWIWGLTAIDNTIYSCSWDRTIKAWSLANTGLVQIRTYEMIVRGALLCIASCAEPSLIASGSSCRTVLVFDPRAGYQPIVRYIPHQRAVIKLAMSPHYILSASEDRTVALWDQRAGRTMKTVTISEQSFPMSVSMHKDVVYVGDSSAKLHVLDPKIGFDVVKCYTTEHTKSITGVHYAPGCLITSSTDKTVRISSPTDPPQNITTLSCKYGEIASIDYLNEVLAISGTEGIEIWRPKTRCSL